MTLLAPPVLFLEISFFTLSQRWMANSSRSRPPKFAVVMTSLKTAADVLDVASAARKSPCADPQGPGYASRHKRDRTSAAREIEMALSTRSGPPNRHKQPFDEPWPTLLI